MKQNESALPIGIFDSGIGGLTVVQSVRKLLPHESILYVGDTARVPYGIKSKESIIQYSTEIVNFLRKRRVKMILIACNSVSAVALDAVIEAAQGIPVLNVIAAGRDAAIETGTTRVGVIGTLATIGSGAYEKALSANGKFTSIKSKACPLLVPLAEEGWTDNDISNRILNLYLDDFLHNGVDSLILGCTHYPLFKKSIQSIFNKSGRTVSIIDSGDAVAEMALATLSDKNILQNSGTGYFHCCVTDRPQRFGELAERFLGEPVKDIEYVHLSS